MKSITQERIVNAHSRRHKWLDSKPEISIHKHLAVHGLNALVSGNKNGQALALDLNFAGAFDLLDLTRRLKQAGIDHNQLVPELESLTHLPTLEAFCIAGWLCLWEHQVERSFKILKKLRDIQVKHEVSSLIEKTIDLGFDTITIKEPHDALEILPADHQFLAEQRFEVATAFIRALHFNGMKLYQRIDEPYSWVELTNSDVVLAAVASSKWALIYSCTQFINNKELKAEGITSVHSMPITADHELEWEIYLDCSTGEFTDSIDKDNIRFGFCAYKGESGPAI